MYFKHIKLSVFALVALANTTALSMVNSGATPNAHGKQKRANFFKQITHKDETTFRNTYGWHNGTLKRESDARKNLTKPGRLGQAIFANGPFSFDSIKDLNATQKNNIFSMGKPQFKIVVLDPKNPQETDILFMQAHPDNKGTAFQIASTFFGPLEGGMADWQTNLEGMLKHPVQGENASIGSAPATIWRKYFMGKVLYSLHHLKDKAPLLKSKLYTIDFDALLKYRYNPSDSEKISIGTHKEVIISTGYSSGSDKNDPQDQIHIAFDRNGTIDPKKCQTVTQIFTAAYPMNYALKQGKYYDKNVQSFAKMILNGMYEGTVKAAYNAGCQKVVLPMLGGGAFRNRLSWIADALNQKEFIQFVKDAGLQVTFVYRPDKYRTEDAQKGYPMRDATEDSAFMSELLKISDEINGTNHAQDTQIKEVVDEYIKNAYEASKNPNDATAQHKYETAALLLKALISE